MAEMTRDQFIKVRMAEGFSKEEAEHAYDHTHDPAIETAQEQKVPTRGEMIQMIHEAKQNSPNKKKLYTPDFSLGREYRTIEKELERARAAKDYVRAHTLMDQLVQIKHTPIVSDDARQAEIDKSLEMPIAAVIAERKKYEAIITECEEKLDNFDVSAVQSKVDALSDQYNRKIKNAGSSVDGALLREEYEKAVNELTLELIKIPMNELKIKRYDALEYFFIYDARLKYYVVANQDLIRAEMENAKREEIRGSLLDLAEELEREDDKKAALGLEG